MATKTRQLAAAINQSPIFTSIKSNPRNYTVESVAAAAPAADQYATPDDLPLSGNQVGDQAFISSTNRLYIWSGSGWYSVALINTSPAFDSGGSPEATYDLDSIGGAATTITLLATDPEGIPIQYSAIPSDSANDLATITQTDNVFVVTSRSLDSIIANGYDSSGGTFNITFRASDGVNLATALSEFTLPFRLPNPLSLIYLDYTGGTEIVVVGGESEATATDLGTAVTSASSGDVIRLLPAPESVYGHFKYNGLDLWGGKSLAFVGDGASPDKIFIWHNHDGAGATRDHPIFVGYAGVSAQVYWKFAYNLTYHRHQVDSTNYIVSLSKAYSSTWGGTMLNCIIDLNNGGVAWNYDNSNLTTYRVSYKHCTFLNYNNWLTSYSGANINRVIDCAFSAAYANDGRATFFGTNAQNVNVNGWTYDNYTADITQNNANLANGVYGHLKDLTNVNSSNTFFNTFQSSN